MTAPPPLAHKRGAASVRGLPRPRHLDPGEETHDEGGDAFALLRDVLATTSLTNVMPTVAVNRRFSVAVPKAPPVDQQAQSGLCWIFAAINVLRRLLIERYALPPDFSLSPSFVYYHSMVEQCNCSLEAIWALARRPGVPGVPGVHLGSLEVERELELRPSDGGEMRHFLDLVEKYGVVPREAYPGTHQSRDTERTKELLQRATRIAAIHLFRGDVTAATFGAFKRRMLAHVRRTLASMLGGIPPPGPRGGGWQRAEGEG